MRISEDFRKEILASFPSLSLDDAAMLAKKCNCHRDMFYRILRDLRKGKEVLLTESVLALAELGTERKKAVIERHKRAEQLRKQLSAVK